MNARRNAFMPNGGLVVVNPDTGAPVLPPPVAPTTAGENERQKTLFGPIIGGEEEVDEWSKYFPSPGSAASGLIGGAISGGEGEKVSVDTVKAWIDKSKSSTNPHPTTTLQSTVNLKRPSLTLSTPSSSSPTNEPTPPTLKFTFDSTSPTVLLKIFILYPLSTKPEILYSKIVPGGFGKTFELLPSTASSDVEGEVSGVAIDWARAEVEGKTIKNRRELLEAQRKEASDAALQATKSAAEEEGAGAGVARPGGLRGILAMRSRARDLEAQTGAGATQMGIVGGDAEETEEAKVKRLADEKRKEGIRVLVRLEGREESGASLESGLNAQLTHVEITSSLTSLSTPTPPTAAQVTPSTPLTEVPPALATEVPVATHKLTWIPKVVRRDALIGSHSFHLREIFGLTSSVQQNQPSSPPTTTYPPQAEPEEDPYASTPNECIVCLVSARDVVLLPCRHLVVCKECAVGMVEFGAGGKVFRRDANDATTELTPDVSGAEGGVIGEAVGAPTPVVTAPAATTTRGRKKKAKGWFCPVCRQPYTSMLRIALPPVGKQLAASTTDGHSVHSVHDHADIVPLPRAPSPTPTLPGRAPSILYPEGVTADEDEKEQKEEDIEPPKFVDAVEELPVAEGSKALTQEEGEKKIAAIA